MQPTWQTSDGAVQLYLGDNASVLPELESESVNCVVTDPPYPKEFSDCWKVLGSPCFRACAENSFLATFLGHYQLPLVLDTVREGGWNFYWVGMIRNNNQPIMHGFRVKCCSKPTLIFSKGNPRPYKIWFDDWGLRSTDKSWNDAQHDHQWGQSWCSVVEPIEAFSDTGGTVLDPFLGSGTTAIACIKLGRRFIGIENNRAHFAKSVRRIEAELNRLPLFEKPVETQTSLQFA